MCGGELLLTRLGCPECATELSGSFAPCEFCNLGTEDRDLLLLFLSSRGNMKELERRLGVSYPTARARFEAVLGRLGLEKATPPEPRLTLLERVAAHELDVDAAMKLLDEP